jgi:hypothetical protein
MGQPVRLSDGLVQDARQVGKVAERSIAGQIEYWARLGRAVETVLDGERALRLKHERGGAPLSACLRPRSRKEAAAELAAHLGAQPFPQFHPVPGKPGQLLRIEADGTRTLGRVVDRTFRPAGAR